MVYRKYDGSLHWHQLMRYLGEDDHGVWLGAPAGCTLQRGSEPPITLPQPFVELIPDGQWWTAAFNGEPGQDRDLLRHRHAAALARSGRGHDG